MSRYRNIEMSPEQAAAWERRRSRSQMGGGGKGGMQPAQQRPMQPRRGGGPMQHRGHGDTFVNPGTGPARGGGGGKLGPAPWWATQGGQEAPWWTRQGGMPPGMRRPAPRSAGGKGGTLTALIGGM